MTHENNDVVEIYVKYRDTLKPLIAEIEALDQHFPVAVLNEIRASFDHIARCYGTNPDITKNIDMAKRHISRAVLDSYKTLIVFFHDRIEDFRKQNKHKDWATVDGGRFNSKFCELQCAAKKCYIEAKRQQDSEHNWLDAYRAYRVANDFVTDPKNVLLVDEGKCKETWLSKLLWCIIGASIGAFLCYIVSACGTTP